MAYDKFQWWNPFDWGGQHSEESMFKSAEENRRIRRAEGRETERDRRDRTSREDRERRQRVSERERRISRERSDERSRDAVRSAERRRKDAVRAAEENLEYVRGKIADAVRNGELSKQEGLAAYKRHEDTWKAIYSEQTKRLGGIQDAQAQLRREVREAPSSVQEQARQNYDTELRQNAALMAIGGGGVSGRQDALRNIAATRNARIMSQTAVARGDEYLKRLGIQSDIAKRESDLSSDLLGIGRDYMAYDRGEAALTRGLNQDIQKAHVGSLNVANAAGLGVSGAELGGGRLEQSGYNLGIGQDFRYDQLALNREKFEWDRERQMQNQQWAEQDRNRRMLGADLSGLGRAVGGNPGAGSLVGAGIGGILGFAVGGPSGAVKGASWGAAGGGAVQNWFSGGQKTPQQQEAYQKRWDDEASKIRFEQNRVVA